MSFSEVIDLVPTVGSRWKHHSGRVYEVLMITNSFSPSDKFPLTVVYKYEPTKDEEAESELYTEGLAIKIWSRKLDEWHGSFTLLPLLYGQIRADVLTKESK